MAKRVRPAEEIGVRINTTQLKILREIRRLAAGGIARVSRGALAKSVNACDATVTTSIRGLISQGLVMVERRYLANGGQLENGYSVTQLGQQILDTAVDIG